MFWPPSRLQMFLFRYNAATLAMYSSSAKPLPYGRNLRLLSTRKHANKCADEASQLFRPSVNTQLQTISTQTLHHVGLSSLYVCMLSCCGRPGGCDIEVKTLLW